MTVVAVRSEAQGSAAWPGWHSQTGPADVLEPLLLLLPLPEQPPAIRPAAITSATPATARRRAPAVLVCLLMAHTPRIHVPEQLSHHGGTAGLGRGRGGTTHT